MIDKRKINSFHQYELTFQEKNYRSQRVNPAFVMEKSCLWKEKVEKFFSIMFDFLYTKVKLDDA